MIYINKYNTNIFITVSILPVQKNSKIYGIFYKLQNNVHLIKGRYNPFSPFLDDKTY